MSTLLPASVATSAAQGQWSFDYTGGEQTFVVPEGVNHLHVTAIGASGAVGEGQEGSGGLGGFGASVSGEIAVTPGQTLYIEVGGVDGEASDVRTSPRAFGLSPDDRLIVAAGGGGGGNGGGGGSFPGLRGGNAGEAGESSGAGGGAPGTDTHGGAGGKGGVWRLEEPRRFCDAGAAGTLGLGGEGGCDP